MQIVVFDLQIYKYTHIYIKYIFMKNLRKLPIKEWKILFINLPEKENWNGYSLKFYTGFIRQHRSFLNQILLSSDNYWRYNPKGEDTVQILLAFYDFTLPFAI